jgi:3-oxoacyl-[acyl-carrier protein] reductase
MDLGLKEKNAIVLGAGSGLGAACAIALAREGVQVALVGRHEETLQTTASTIAAHGGRSRVVVWDTSNPADAAAKVNTITQAFGSVDILVNNTGGPPPTPAAGQPVDTWTTYFQSMVVGVIAITDAVLPGMKSRQWGRVISIASSGVIAPIPNLALSNSLRLALAGWSKTLAREVAADGITANLVLPGRVATDRVKFLDESKAKREAKAFDQVVKESLATIPMGRYGKPEEFGSTVAFLASQQAAYITGSMIRVDGGLLGNL